MPIRKKGNIDIRTSAKGAQATQTGYTFYSYDKNSAALYFQFRGQDGQPTDLDKATIHLVMILNDDGGKEFIPKSDEIEVISAIRGTAKYVLPEMLLSYSGKVTGYVYMDFDDGSQSDDGQFTFRIKHSMITHVLPEAGDKYVQDFEDVKERVEQAGDSATKDIEKAKDDAESQIGDYVGEVERAKDSTIEDIDKALLVDEAKNYTDDKVEEFNETITTQLAQKGNQEDLEKTNMNLEQVAKRVNVLDRLPENLTGLIANSIIAIPEKTIPLSWNAVDWELGSIATVSGAPFTGTIRIRTPNFLTIEPNTKYATFLVTTDDGSNASESLINYFFYKDDNTYIESTGWLSNNQSFTTPSETSKLKVVVRNVVDNVTITTEYITVAKPILSRVY